MLALLAIVALTVTVATPASARASAAATTVSKSLTTLIGELPVDSTAHSGYQRTLFKTWVDADGDGCDTREEVLLAEAVTAPTQGSGCTLTGGSWYSWYDEATWTNKSDVDIDHVVSVAVRARGSRRPAIDVAGMPSTRWRRTLTLAFNHGPYGRRAGQGPACE